MPAIDLASLFLGAVLGVLALTLVLLALPGDKPPG